MFTTLRVIPSGQPVIEPVDLATTKVYLRSYQNYEDDLISSLITTARIMCEEYLARSIVSQTYAWTMKSMDTPNTCFSSINFGVWNLTNPLSHETLELPRAPVQSIVSVTLHDFAGTDITIDNTVYTVDLKLEPARLRIYWSKVNEIVTPPVYPLQHIVVEFVAGYDDTNPLPSPIKQAILLYVSYLYENRGDSEPYEMPKTIHALLDQYRILYFGGGV